VSPATPRTVGTIVLRGGIGVGNPLGVALEFLEV
jgi:hypothetical protein